MLVYRAAAVTMSALFASAAMAQPASAPAATAPPDFSLPHAFAGYSQPEITDCTAVAPTKRTCTVPAMTAGRYLIVAAAGATATATKSTQSLSIKLDGRSCAATEPVAFTGNKGLRIGCLAEFLTDNAITVSADYAVSGATVDGAGTQLSVRRVPWMGIMDAKPEVLPAPPPRPAAAGK